MAFKQTDPGRYAYAFEAMVMSGNIVTIGKVVEFARRLDPSVHITTMHRFEQCIVTICSNEPKVERMVRAFSDV
jgi:hypothetical protein